MLSKRDRQGYLLIDNRHAPGPDGTRFLEAATITCNHCQRQMLRRPDRPDEERAWCRSCDSYICNDCEPILRLFGCKTFSKTLDDHEKRITRQGMI